MEKIMYWRASLFVAVRVIQSMRMKWVGLVAHGRYDKFIQYFGGYRKDL
jgi:hypothetical protein